MGTLLTKLEMAAFELNVRPYSEWINAFSLDEWVSYGYTQDLQYYYCAGYVVSYALEPSIKMGLMCINNAALVTRI